MSVRKAGRECLLPVVAAHWKDLSSHTEWNLNVTIKEPIE